ncbi:MAG: carbonic anhydrase [Acetobacteraceae bacterium]|nr:carbonic anhydrase [Acetobacteraceae bacterium]
MTPDEALRALREGNERFATDAPFRADIGSRRRAETARGQGPFAAILCCTDSRTTPELVFSRGIGELFVVRTAGNVADAVALGSAEYSVAALGAPLLVVMGHASCGAAAAEMAERNATFPGSIGDVARPIVPAVRAVRGRQGDLLGNAVRENAIMAAQSMIERSPVLQEAVRKDKLRVIAAHYGLANGRVEFLGG